MSSQAFRGWRKRAPPKSRLPLPIEAVFLIALQLVQEGFWATAVYVLLLVNTYMRPSEALTIRGRDLVSPVAGKRHSH